MFAFFQYEHVRTVCVNPTPDAKQLLKTITTLCKTQAFRCFCVLRVDEQWVYFAFHQRSALVSNIDMFRAIELKGEEIF